MLIEWLVCRFKKMIQGESWLLPNSSSRKRGTQYMWQTGVQSVLWCGTGRIHQILSCLYKRLIVQLPVFAILQSHYFPFQIPWPSWGHWVDLFSPDPIVFKSCGERRNRQKLNGWFLRGPWHQGPAIKRQGATWNIPWLIYSHAGLLFYFGHT